MRMIGSAKCHTSSGGLFELRKIRRRCEKCATSVYQNDGGILGAKNRGNNVKYVSIKTKIDRKRERRTNTKSTVEREKPNQNAFKQIWFFVSFFYCVDVCLCAHISHAWYLKEFGLWMGLDPYIIFFYRFDVFFYLFTSISILSLHCCLLAKISNCASVIVVVSKVFQNLIVQFEDWFFRVSTANESWY